MFYKVKSNIGHDGKSYVPGDSIHLTPEQAASMPWAVEATAKNISHDALGEFVFDAPQPVSTQVIASVDIEIPYAVAPLPEEATAIPDQDAPSPPAAPAPIEIPAQIGTVDQPPGESVQLGTGTHPPGAKPLPIMKKKARGLK